MIQRDTRPLNTRCQGADSRRLTRLLKCDNGIDDMTHTLNGFPNGTREVSMLFTRLILQDFGITRNNGQRRPQLVRECVHAVILGLP